MHARHCPLDIWQLWLEWSGTGALTQVDRCRWYGMRGMFVCTQLYDAQSGCVFLRTRSVRPATGDVSAMVGVGRPGRPSARDRAPLHRTTAQRASRVPRCGGTVGDEFTTAVASDRSWRQSSSHRSPTSDGEPSPLPRERRLCRIHPHGTPMTAMTRWLADFSGLQSLEIKLHDFCPLIRPHRRSTRAPVGQPIQGSLGGHDRWTGATRIVHAPRHRGLHR